MAALLLVVGATAPKDVLDLSPDGSGTDSLRIKDERRAARAERRMHVAQHKMHILRHSHHGDPPSAQSSITLMQKRLKYKYPHNYSRSATAVLPNHDRVRNEFLVTKKQVRENMDPREVHDWHQRKDLLQLAQRTCSILTEMGVKYWLDFSTLLGLMRERNILEGDSDIDISVVDTPDNVEKVEAARTPLADMGVFLKKELTWNAYRAASRLGYAHLYLAPLNNGSYKVTIGDSTEIKADLIGEPQLLDWQGTQVSIPQHAHAVLISRYGDDYLDPEAYYSSKDFTGRHPGSDGWNKHVRIRADRIQARRRSMINAQSKRGGADAESLSLPASPSPLSTPATTQALHAKAIGPESPDEDEQSAPQPKVSVADQAPSPSAQALEVFDVRESISAPTPAPVVALSPVRVAVLEPEPRFKPATGALKKDAVSFERRVERGKNYVKKSAMQAESDRAYAMLGNAIQHHEQMLDNLQVQLDLTADDKVRERLAREIAQHREARARAELEQATLPGDQGRAVALRKHQQGRQQWTSELTLQKIWEARTQQHVTEREEHQTKEAERQVRVNALTDHQVHLSHADGAALALGNTVQYEKQLVDNLEARLASTTDPATTDLLKVQIAGHREAAARAELEAINMDGSEQRPNGMTRDNKLVRLSNVRLSKRTQLLRADLCKPPCSAEATPRLQEATSWVSHDVVRERSDSSMVFPPSHHPKDTVTSFVTARLG